MKVKIKVANVGFSWSEWIKPSSTILNTNGTQEYEAYGTAERLYPKSKTDTVD